MSRWLLLMCTGCLIIIVSSSPILNEETKSKDEQVARQSNEVTNAAAPPASASPAASNSEDDDDDDEDDDEDDLDLTDDDDDEEEGEAASDDDDDDDDDYDFERILDDILGDDDDEEEEEEEPASDAASAAPQAAVSSTAAPVAPIQGLAASPIEEVAEQNIEQAAITNDEEDQVADENNSHTVTLLTNSQPDDVDEAQELALNTNDLGAAASETISTAVAPANQAPAAASDDDDDEEEEEEDDEDDNVLGDDDDEDEDEEDDDEARKARNMQGGAVPIPSSYIAKYNNYVDTIFGRINKVLKKNYDPVNVRLQTAPDQKKKPTSAKSSSKYKKKQPARPSSRNDESNNSTASAIQTDPDEVQHRSARVMSRRSRLIQKRKAPNKATTSPKPSKKTLRAKATLYGLSSLRRDGDVIVNVMSTHTTVRSRFLVGPLTLKVEKEFGRGAKKEMRSATATTAEMFGKLNLKVVHGGDTSLSSIKVMQPKQMRVETPDDNDKTREFLWKRSSNLAHLVSQKLTNAAKSFMKPVTASSAQNQTVNH